MMAFWSLNKVATADLPVSAIQSECIYFLYIPAFSMVSRPEIHSSYTNSKEPPHLTFNKEKGEAINDFALNLRKLKK